jgi:hypothetical protein
MLQARSGYRATPSQEERFGLPTYQLFSPIILGVGETNDDPP